MDQNLPNVSETFREVKKRAKKSNLEFESFAKDPLTGTSPVSWLKDKSL